MKIHEATEQAYKNGYDKGYEDGKKDAVKRGRWIMKEIMLRMGVPKGAYCSECGEETAIPSNYCPNCGADMRKPPKGE